MTLKNKSLIGLVFVLFVLFVVILAGFGTGCACPHRKALTTHVVEVFNPEQRCDGLLARETWRDQEGGGGIFLFADPTVQAMTATHTNQWALGGGSAFAAGSFAILVDSNLVPAIAATGTAAGNIVGAAVKTAVK
ncbi:MAG: hypothetical protein ACLQU4_12070 [Limisphaerales bacterium]